MNNGTSQDTFLDIHMHAFNLSHPNFYAFLRRYRLLPESLLDAGIRVVALAGAIIVLLVGLVYAIVFGIISLFGLPFLASVLISFFVAQAIIILLILFLRKSKSLRRFITTRIRQARNRFTNMLSVFENDIGSFFLVLENCLREDKNKWPPLLQGDTIIIGDKEQGKRYKRVVLTPLMMDFGYKSKDVDRGVHYNEPGAKPVNEQVLDVFNAIRWYREATYARYSTRLTRAYAGLRENSRRFFEIYPFMAINAQNYELEEIEKMLVKYFSAYRGSRDDLLANLGKFDGDVRSIRSNFFAGVKVYPPLGFDPWPEDAGGREQKKVECLYRFCAEHRVPITTHGGSSGFVAVDDNRKLLEMASVSRWEAVLRQYPSLKLNIAHFPAEVVATDARKKSNHEEERERLEKVIALILKSDNVYTDFSCRAFEDDYYRHLKAVLYSLAESDRKKLTARILFGSDFPVVLGSIDSYSRYVHIFAESRHLTPEEKHAFCCVNPQRFLFT